MKRSCRACIFICLLMVGLIIGGLSLNMAGFAPKPIDNFAQTGPQFDPLRFWMGHKHSWGVLENRNGEPIQTIETDCIGTAEGSNGLHMVQTLTFQDGRQQHRDWHMRKTAPNRYEATANDMVGKAIGQSAGAVFHWNWVLANHPGNALYNIDLDQWMYQMPNGSMVNRTTIRKLGIVVAEVTEQFDSAHP